MSSRQAMAEKMRGVREVRSVASSPMEVRESAASDEPVTFVGLASRTGTPYDMYSYQETIARGAFAETLKRTPDVQFLANHEGLPMARSIVPAGQIGSLRLYEDDEGLHYEALCDPADPDVQRLALKVRSGLMSQSSFAFRVIRQQWRWTEDTGLDQDQREIQEVSLDRGDVSAVNFGASPTTNVTARALLDVPDSVLRQVLIEMSDEEFAAIERARDKVPAQVTEEPIAPVHDLDYYRARAYVLGAHK
jgi:HK97 family phage prohead protease